MASFLLRVEGVNFSSFIYDTQDLSTIRGASLLLLDAAVEAQRKLQEEGYEVVKTWTGDENTVMPIIKGASIGLFRITPRAADTQTQLTAEHLAIIVSEALNAWQPSATFVVDVVVDESQGRAPRARLHTATRWRQMQSPSIVYPESPLSPQPETVCEIDKVRPVTLYDAHTPEGKHWQSAATHARRDHGRRKKQAFYEHEIETVAGRTPPKSRFTQSFDGLCGHSVEWGNLSDKMAVIYLDGNKFGRFTSQSTERSQTSFSRRLRKEQATILSDLMDKIESETDWTTDKDDGDWSNNGTESMLRFETLLWGGEEIIWVVPAWKGWEVLSFFFQRCDVQKRDDWDVEDSARPSDNSHPHLTYTAAIVFCQNKTPIRGVVELARGLADRAKTEGTLANSPSDHRLLYQVLESFDDIDRDDPALGTRLLTPPMMRRIAAAMPRWRETIPRRQLHRVLTPPRAGEADASERVAAAHRAILAAMDVAWSERQVAAGGDLDESARVPTDSVTAASTPLSSTRPSGDVRVLAKDVATLRGETVAEGIAPPDVEHPSEHDLIAWRHIAELWDYVMPEKIERPEQESNQSGAGGEGQDR